MQLCVAFVSFACLLFSGTEAIRGRDITATRGVAIKETQHVSVHTEHVASKFAADHVKENAMMQQMNVTNAISIISKLNGSHPAMVKLIQSQLNVVKAHLRQKQPDGGVAAARAAGSYGSGAQRALDMLNEMLLEAIEKMDFEVVRCDSEERTNLALLAEIREDIIMFNGMSAGAATTMNKAKGDMTRFTGLLKDTKAEFQENDRVCKLEMTDVRNKLKVVASDLDVMKIVVGLANCDAASAAAAASLFQCVDTRTKRQWTEMRPSQKLKDAIAKVQNPKVRELLENDEIFLESGLKSQPAQVDQGSAAGLVEPPAGLVTGTAASTNKCTLAASPMCPKIREKFSDLAGEVYDSWNELKLMQKNLILHCQSTQAAISSQIVNYGNVISETNEKLSGSTKDWGTYNGQSSQKENEEHDVHKEHKDTMTACYVNIENLASEKCALKKIRGELLKMDSLPSVVTDCDVGEWQAEPCSVDCGGGVQNLTRSLTPGSLGCKCPAGKAQQTCNEDRCPVDCVMEEWSEWGSCTALCDGGIKERARGIKVPALTKAAVQCEETAETVPCNVQACSGDCLLSDWTSWTTQCSKPCSGGEVTRVKNLARPAFGTGTCPAFYDAERYQVQACNTQECPPTEKLMRCEANTDVVIMFDGSASMGEDGWEQVKKGAAELAKAFSGPHVAISSLLFSGPSNFDNVAPCMGQGSNGRSVDLVKDCGIQWVSRFDDNKTGDMVAEEITKQEFPQGTTLTSLALAEAGAELIHGRSGANSIVIVMTDGAPLSVLECSKQAQKLKKKARVMWVPVGDKLQDDSIFSPWASSPSKDNIVRVKDLNMLPKPFTINSILTNFCPDLFYGNVTINEYVEETKPTDSLGFSVR